MLYVTTRNDRDTYPASLALRENRNSDGGFYVPFQITPFSNAQIQKLAEMPFNACVAEVLNFLFQSHLSSWDVDFSIGRYPVQLKKMGHRTFLAELWHNPDWSYARTAENLAKALCGEHTESVSWARIAIRIAILFGIFRQLHQKGIFHADICMVSGDFSAPVSAWYARQWGLPIDNIVCTCNENHTLWDLISYGQMRTNQVSIQTCVPEADVTLPQELERLIFACGGTDAVEKYRKACHTGSIYMPDDELLLQLRTRLYTSVVSSKRLETAIPGIYRTHQYVMAPGTALAYAGLQDYRAKTGENRYAVVLSDYSPLCFEEAVAQMLHTTPEALRRNLL